MNYVVKMGLKSYVHFFHENSWEDELG